MRSHETFTDKVLWNCKAYAVFLNTGEKTARSIWELERHVRLTTSHLIPDNCNYKAVVQISVKSMDEISVTIQPGGDSTYESGGDARLLA